MFDPISKHVTNMPQSLKSPVVESATHYKDWALQIRIHTDQRTDTCEQTTMGVVHNIITLQALLHLFSVKLPNTESKVDEKNTRIHNLQTATRLIL